MSETTLNPASLTVPEIEEAMMSLDPASPEHAALAEELAARITGIDV